MKKFFKRANRGLLLGGIVIVGFVAFVITDTISFKKNKPVIEDEIKSYVSSLEELGVTKDKDKKTYNSEVNDLINEYWTFSSEKSNSFYYGLDQNYFRNSLELMASNSNDDSYVSKWTAKVNGVDVSKAGSGYAIATFTCEIVAEFNGDAYLLTPADASPANNYAYYGETAPQGLCRLSLDATYQATMTKKDGEWKISLVQEYGWNSSELTAVDESEGGNKG